MPDLKTILLALLVPASAGAQKIALHNSTRCDWSGGIAGRAGSNYTFALTVQGTQSVFIPDTIWIGEHPIPILVDSGNHKPFNTRISVKKREMQIDISAGTVRDYNMLPFPDREDKEPPEPPVKYNGVALLSYRYNGRRGYFAIPRIMVNYPAVNYP